MTREPASAAPPSTVEQRDLKTSYLELLKLCLTGLAVPRPGSAIWPHGGEVQVTPLARSEEVSKRSVGCDWPVEGFTMIGLERLSNLQDCVEDTIRRGVPGDFIETGVWRGGATIFMRGYLAAHFLVTT